MMMKKFFSMMVALATVFSFVACSEKPNSNDEPGKPDGGKLEMPVLTSDSDGETSFTIKWDAVKGADSYMLNLRGKNYTTTDCYYLFENLNAGDYTVRVKAIGEGYTDSDFASITVTLTGATSIDWFTQTIAPAELNEELGYTPYNALTFVWKGTGVTELAYGLFPSSALELATDDQIIDAISTNTLEVEALADVNSEAGMPGTFSPLSGGTSYTLCTYVTNEAGIKFLVKTECATESAVASEEAMKWVGNWNVKSHKAYSINAEGKGTVIDKEDEFSVTITASPNSPNELYLDGFSVMGEGWPAAAEVDGNTLYILNGTYMGSSEDGSSDYLWLGWYNFPEEYGGLTISADPYPSFILQMDEAGNVTCTNKFSMYDQDQNEVPVECYCSDICGLTQDGYIQFFIEAFPAVFRSGDMDWTRTEAAAAVMSFDARKKSLPMITTSLVVAE